MLDIDPEAARREGLTCIACPKCGAGLAWMERDGRALRTSRSGTTAGRVRLYCTKCRVYHTWRPGANLNGNGSA
jgi:hypothetical protein